MQGILESLYNNAEWYIVLFSFLAIPTAAYLAFYIVVHRYSQINFELPAIKFPKKKKQDGKN